MIKAISPIAYLRYLAVLFCRGVSYVYCGMGIVSFLGSSRLNQVPEFVIKDLLPSIPGLPKMREFAHFINVSNQRVPLFFVKCSYPKLIIGIRPIVDLDSNNGFNLQFFLKLKAIIFIIIFYQRNKGIHKFRARSLHQIKGDPVLFQLKHSCSTLGFRTLPYLNPDKDERNDYGYPSYDFGR